jgi:hypothetical protein
MLFTLSYFCVALAAIYRPAFTWLKRHFSFLATLGTYRGEHLSLGSVAIATAVITLCFPCLAARWTTLRLVGIASGLEELLFFYAESKGSPTIRTLNRLLLKSQGMTSSLLIVGLL